MIEARSYVIEPDAYEAWLAGKPAGESSPVAAGEALFVQASPAIPATAPARSQRGPALEGVFGSEVDLATGRHDRC